MTSLLHPSLFQLNTRIFLGELGRQLGKPATFDDIPDDWLDRLVEQGFDWVWFMGVWQTGEMGRTVSRTFQPWRDHYSMDLPDFTDDDICGSPFAVKEYTPHSDFGTRASLLHLRDRLAQ